MGNAIARRPEQQLLGRTEVGNKFSEDQAKQEFSAIVEDFEARQLAKMAGITPEGARKWLSAAACPNVASAVNIARHIPAVADWIAQRCGMERAVQAKSYDAWIQGLYQIASGNGLDAQQARAAIAQLVKCGAGP
jgi:hypothetical protein